VSVYWIGFWNGVSWAAIVGVIGWLLVAAWIVFRKWED